METALSRHLVMSSHPASNFPVRNGNVICVFACIHWRLGFKFSCKEWKPIALGKGALFLLASNFPVRNGNSLRTLLPCQTAVGFKFSCKEWKQGAYRRMETLSPGFKFSCKEWKQTKKDSKVAGFMKLQIFL